MKMTKLTLHGAGILLLATTSCSTCQKSETGRRTEPAYVLPNLVQYTRPMCGTGRTLGNLADSSNLYPGATLPFGMMRIPESVWLTVQWFTVNS